jgi:hypothetical protein
VTRMCRNREISLTCWASYPERPVQMSVKINRRGQRYQAIPRVLYTLDAIGHVAILLPSAQF